MRKIVVEFIVPADAEEDYADVCSELVIQDFLGLPLKVLSDSGWPPVDEGKDANTAEWERRASCLAPLHTQRERVAVASDNVQ